MSRIKDFYEEPEDKIQRTARKIIKAKTKIKELDKTRIRSRRAGHRPATETSFCIAIEEGIEYMLKLMQKLIDHSPWWSKFQVGDTLTVMVRMADGELVHFKTRYNYHHQLTNVKIHRFMD